MRKNNRALGAQAEELACKYLEKMNYKIIEKNFRCRTGEIDMIAFDKGVIVFIEVKYRKDCRLGHPREAVHYYKQRNITKVASYYLISKGQYDKSCRFDVVEIIGQNIKLIQNAFDAMY